MGTVELLKRLNEVKEAVYVPIRCDRLLKCLISDLVCENPKPIILNGESNKGNSNTPKIFKDEKQRRGWAD